MGRQGEERQVGAARRRSRGHGLARLDGTRPRATVADKVMESGETAGHGNGRCDVLNRTQAQARRPEAGSRAIGVRDVEGWPMPVPSGMSEQRTWSSVIREAETQRYVSFIICLCGLNNPSATKKDMALSLDLTLMVYEAECLQVCGNPYAIHRPHTSIAASSIGVGIRQLSIVDRGWHESFGKDCSG